MAQKHLKELLKEDQEPFQLKDYIADRKCQVKKQIQVKKAKSMSKCSSFFTKNACFFSLQQNSPDYRKSPLYDFATKSPCKSPNRVFLHVPAKTAALLLEAAMRIQKQTKPKTQVKGSGFGLFGSMLKRLTHRSKAQKLKGNETGEFKTEENRGGVNNELATISTSITTSTSSYSYSSSSSSSCSCNGRQSSLDLESSSTGRSVNGDDEDEDYGFEFANVLRGENGGLCLSPFRFALHNKSPSSGRLSPVFSSPAKSPSCRKIEDNLYYEQENSGKFREEEDEEDKEQNSPVSVLDPPFEDDYDGQEEEEGGGYDLECSYAFVQITAAKQHLLHKLHRFEKLAELDPFELEKRLIEDENEVDQAKRYEEYEYESFTIDEQRQVDEFIHDIIRKSGFQDLKKPGIKRLVSDLILEEEEDNALDENDDELLIKRVCKRLESWKEVEANTIDMMVEMDLRRESGEWKKPQDKICEAANDIEFAIFAALVEELVQDLC